MQRPTRNKTVADFGVQDFFSFYQAIERLRRKLRPSAGLRSAEVLHFRIGDLRRACSRVAHNDRYREAAIRSLSEQKRAWREHSKSGPRDPEPTSRRCGLYLQSCYDFASSNLLLPSRRLNSMADKDSSRTLVFRMLRQRLLLPLRHNMRVDGLSG